MNQYYQIAIQRNTEINNRFRNKAVISLLMTLVYAITGRLHIKKERIGELIISGDGKEYTIFRQVIVDSLKGRKEESTATLIIRFDLAHGSPKQNILLSLIPIPFIVGLHGFRSKVWAIQEDTGGFQGIYEWDSVQDARNYKKSFAIKLMTKRALPDSVSFRIISPLSTEK